MLLNIPITYHLSELRIRFLYIIISILCTSLVCYYYSEEVLTLVSKPLLSSKETSSFIFTDITEVFVIYLKMSLFISLYLCFPVILYQIWMFLVPGLYPNESNFLKFIIILSLVLVILSIVVSYYLIFPIAIKFFLNFEFNNSTDYYTGPVSLHLEAKINEFVLLIFKSLALFSISFQFPVIILIVVYLNVISASWFVKKRRYFILSAFIIAALLSPPDLFSQILIVIPLLILYEILVFSFKLYQNYTTNGSVSKPY